MRYFTGVFFALLTIALCWLLDGKRTSSVPLAMGRFLDPFHGCWQNAECKDEYQDLELELDNLKAPVSIVYDQRRVPHIFAQNDEDLYFAQGFVTARDRLWQMEFQVRAAGGRLSEVIADERVINLDRETRRRGMTFGAENGLRAMEADPVLKPVLDAYTNGINAYIESLSSAEYPLEFKLLDYSPEPWTNLKTALLLKYMAWMLTGRSMDFENSNSLIGMGWERYADVHLTWSDSISPIIPKDKIWEFDSVYVPVKPLDSVPLETVETMRYSQPEPMNGSNNWAVHGSKTKSGRPILANDPHLGLSFPSIWYEISLSTPEHTVHGASLPGSPAVISGFNQDVAWGVTNAARDVQDWYQIEFKDAQKDEYRYGDEWKKVEYRVEELKMRNGGTLYDTVRYTVHGPIVYDESFGHPDGQHPIDLAMKWVAHGESEELMTFYLLNRAKNEAEYRKAISYFKCPGQNFVFASNEGDVAITQQGLFPNKWEGQGLFVMDGSNPDHDWQGFIPIEHNPYVKNPARGFVSSANQHPTDSTYPYRIDGLYEWNRNRRINQALAGMSDITVDDMKQFQSESFNQLASEVLRSLLNQIEVGKLSPTGKAAFDALNTWNLFSDPDEVAPCYFHVWLSEMNFAFWQADIAASTGPVNLPPSYLATHFLAFPDSMQDSLFDIRNRAELLLSTLETSASVLETWKQDHPGEELKWLNFNNPRVVHLSRQNALSRFRIPIGGDAGVVSAVKGNHGPSWKMIVELGEKPQGFAIYPGGQSGNPGSYWYDNMVADWAAGKYYPIEYYQSAEEASAKATSTLTFKPAQP